MTLPQVLVMNIPTPIATRALEVLDEHRQVIATAMVSLGHPEREPGADLWSCPYRIEGLGDDQPYRGPFATDALGAVANAIFIIGTTLQGSDESQADRLRWAGSAYFRAAFLRLHLAPEDGLCEAFGDVLAEKELASIHDAWSREGPVTFALGRPRRAASGVWFCPYRLAGLGVSSTWWASGFDSLHAVQGALFLIEGFDDHVSEVFKRHERWARSVVLGFPTLPEEPPTP